MRISLQMASERYLSSQPILQDSHYFQEKKIRVWKDVVQLKDLESA